MTKRNWFLALRGLILVFGIQALSIPTYKSGWFGVATIAFGCVMISIFNSMLEGDND